MATLKNDRNELLNSSTERIVGGTVVLAPSSPANIVIPKGGASITPATITLKANAYGGYVSPTYVWEYKFGNSADYTVVAEPGNGTFISLAGDTLTIDTSGDFYSLVSTDTFLQIKVSVSSPKVNTSTYTFAVPIIREGSDAKAIILTASNQAVNYDKDGTSPSPSTISLVANSYNTGSMSINYKFLVDASTLATVSSTTGTASTTYTIPSTYFSTPKLVKVEARDSTTGILLTESSLSIIAVKAATPGTSTYAATVYLQQATQPSTPVATASSYNFSTGVLTPPSGWSVSQPASTTTPTWACDYVFSGTAGSTVTGSGSWSTPYIEAQSGTNGEYRDTIQLYLQSATAPTQPTSASYLFSTNTIALVTGGTAGWSMTRPAASTTPIYVTTCLASTTTPATGVILTSWSAPVIVAQNGTPGADATILSYTNSSLTVPQTAAGVSTWTGSGGSLEVLEGTTKLTLASTTQSTTTPATSGQYVLDITRLSGDILTEPTISGTTTVTVSDWSGALSTATIYRITAYIKTQTGVNITRSVDVSIAASKAGSNGNDATAYWLATSAPTIQKTITGVYTPSTVTYSLYSATGTNSPTSYSGRFVIATSTDGITYTSVYTSASNESSYTYTVPASIKTIRVRGYLAGGTTTLLDEEITTVVSDGATGAQGSAAIQVGFTRSIEVITTDQYGSIGSISWPTGNSAYILDGTTLKAVGTSGITAAIVNSGNYTNPMHGITLAIDSTGAISYTATSWSPVNNTTEFKVGLTYNGVTYYGYLKLNRARASERGSITVSKTLPTVTGASSGLFKYPGRAGGKAEWTSGTGNDTPVFSETYAGYVDTEATKAICDTLGYATTTSYLRIGDTVNLLSPGSITTPLTTTYIDSTSTVCAGLVEKDRVIVALANTGTQSRIYYSTNNLYTSWVLATYSSGGTESTAILSTGYEFLKKVGGYLVAYGSYATGSAGKLLVSTTGTYWTDAIPPTTSIDQVTAICMGKDEAALVYRISTNTYIGFTKDFSTWNLSSAFAGVYAYSIAYSSKHNRYVLGTADGRVIYSDVNSKSTWTTLSNTDTKVGNSLISKIAYGNGILVAVAENQKIVVSYTGGTTWELGNTGSIVPYGTVKALEFINNQFILSLYTSSTTEQKVYTSADGLVWANAISSTNGTVNAIVYSDNLPDKVIFGTYPPAGQTYAAVTTATMTLKQSIQGYWDGTKWAAPGTYIDGNLLVKGSVAANAIAANSITGDKVFANSITADKISSSSNVGTDGSFNLDVSSNTVNNKFAIGQFTTNSTQKFAISGLSLNSAATGTAGVAGGAVSGGSGLAAFNAKTPTFSTFNTALTLANASEAGYMKRHRSAGSQTEAPSTEITFCSAGAGIGGNYYGESSNYPILSFNLNYNTTTVAGDFTCRNTSGQVLTNLQVAGTGYAAYGIGKIYSTLGFTPFTGIHDGLIDTIAEQGDIIVDVEVLSRIDISNSILKMRPSTIPNQKGVIGVCNIIFEEPPSDWKPSSGKIEYPNGMDEDTSLRPPIYPAPNLWACDIPEGYKVIHVNAVGEGLINVCGQGGNIELGDLIVTSSIPGKGMRQADDIVRSITVAKSREPVSFDYPEQIKQIACIYVCG